MSLHRHAIAVGLCLSLAATGAFATAGEKVDSAVQAASGAATKTGRAVKHGAKAAASGVEHGAHAAASGVERGAKAVGNTAHKGAEKVGIAASSPKP